MDVQQQRFDLMAVAEKHQRVTALLYVYFTVSCIQGLRHWARAEVGENAGAMKSMPAGPRNIGPKAPMPEYCRARSFFGHEIGVNNRV